MHERRERERGCLDGEKSGREREGKLSKELESESEKRGEKIGSKMEGREKESIWRGIEGVDQMCWSFMGLGHLLLVARGSYT